MRDLVVLSHLRWTYVWQRPQHVIARLARNHNTLFVEEPLPSEVTAPTLAQEQHDRVRRLWLEVPSRRVHIPFGDDLAARYNHTLRRQVRVATERIVWLYTPLALDLVESLEPTLVVYDVMDDLASFKDAPESLRLCERQALARADLVFAGGRSLYQRVSSMRPGGTYLFASGVEPEHYAAARRTRTEKARPVAGYVGVIDERLDLALIARLAQLLPDWEIHMVGPIAKIDGDSVPHAPNLRYLGQQPYERLPEIMSGFDVALMPFELNDATRSISPTKTLEYLAAGLPVVSTWVPDVVADYETVVDLQDDAAGFACACRRVLRHSVVARDRKLMSLLKLHHWDAIAARMQALIEEALDEKRWTAEARRSRISG